MKKLLIFVFFAVLGTTLGFAGVTSNDIMHAVRSAARVSFEWGWLCARQQSPKFRNSDEFVNYYFPVQP